MLSNLFDRITDFVSAECAYSKRSDMYEAIERDDARQLLENEIENLADVLNSLEDRIKELECTKN